MKLTFEISGREMTFSESELIGILEKHFASEIKPLKQEQNLVKGKYFEVNPSSINQEIFSKERENERQEKTRKIIMEAFVKMKEEPEKYARPFKTMVPLKTWSVMTVEELKEVAENMGDHIADLVEQALEWAQRISNGETWETVCNEASTEDWHRLIAIKDDSFRIVGGARKDNAYYPASDISNLTYCSNYNLSRTVPLIVCY